MVRILDIHPAFGFETNERFRVAASQRDARLIQEGRNLGDYAHREWAEQRMICNNVSKILGYIPVVGTIIGIGRIIFMLNNQERDPAKQKIVYRHIFRGAAEVFLSPLLLLILDIAFTVLDYHAVRAYNRINLQHP